MWRVRSLKALFDITFWKYFCKKLILFLLKINIFFVFSDYFKIKKIILISSKINKKHFIK